jgi:hypothetical protein
MRKSAGRVSRAGDLLASLATEKKRSGTILKNKWERRRLIERTGGEEVF